MEIYDCGDEERVSKEEGFSNWLELSDDSSI